MILEIKPHLETKKFTGHEGSGETSGPQQSSRSMRRVVKDSERKKSLILFLSESAVPIGEDDETGLYYAQARYYDPEIARFASADPLQYRPAELMKRFGTNPQAFNYYAYAGNNPIKLVDPTGEVLILIFPDISTPEVKEFVESLTGGEQTIRFGTLQDKDLQYSTTEKVAIITAGSLGLAQTGASLIQVLKGLLKELFKEKTATTSSQQPKTFSQKDVPKNVKDQVPKEWGEGKPSDGGWRWADPENPSRTIRYQPGNPESPNPAQQNSYVKQGDGKGSFFDKFGNSIKSEKPSKEPSSHIPAQEFKFHTYD